VTIDAEYAAPLTGPMHAMLSDALSPYLDGDLDASDDLIGSLLDVIACAENTPELVKTLHEAIRSLPPTRELMPAMHDAIGEALELKSPAPASNGYGNTGSNSRQATARTSSGTSKEGSIAGRIKGIFNNHPGQTYRVGDLVKALSATGHDHSGGAVGAALTNMVARGEAVQVGEKPKLYLAADDPEVPQQTTEAAPETADQAPVTAEAPEATTETPDPDTAQETAPDTAKATPARRSTAKK
jgi:hypothetical protein